MWGGAAPGILLEWRGRRGRVGKTTKPRPKLKMPDKMNRENRLKRPDEHQQSRRKHTREQDLDRREKVAGLQSRVFRLRVNSASTLIKKNPSLLWPAPCLLPPTFPPNNGVISTARYFDNAPTSLTRSPETIPIPRSSKDSVDMPTKPSPGKNITSYGSRPAGNPPSIVCRC